MSEANLVETLVQQARLRLYGSIQTLHGTMPLWCVDRLVPLSKLFVDVNILQSLNSSCKSELNDLWQDFTANNSSFDSLDRIGLGRKQKRVPGLEVLEQNTNLMVVGKPGSGKTTYLQRIVTECNQGKLQAQRIPVLIILREFVDDGRLYEYNLEQFLRKLWQLRSQDVELLLNQGRALVLLDGLDEVTGETGKQIAKEIKRFARTYPQVQVVVTCRTQSQELRFERFDYIEVADFDEKQVRTFAVQWFDTVCADVSKVQTREFLEHLFREENKPIRELAITPILLSLTCAVFYHTGKFYSKRSKLYEEGFELLLEQWDKSRSIERDEIYQDLSVERKLELLSDLAMKKFEAPQYVLFEQEELEGYIEIFLGISQRDSRFFLRAIETQHGLLIERAQKVWSFSHLTFQEYLTAKKIINDNQVGKLVTEHLAEERWREVFLSVAESIDAGDKLLELMQTQITNHIDTPKLRSLLDWTHQVTVSSLGDFRPVAKRVAALIFAVSIPLSSKYDIIYNRALELNIVLIHDREIAIKFASNLASSRARVYATEKGLAEAQARSRNPRDSYYYSNFDRNRTFHAGCSFALDLTIYFAKLEIFQNINFPQLISKLRELDAQVPHYDSLPEMHDEFDKYFTQTWFQFVNIEQQLLDLSEQEIETLSKYLYMCQLITNSKEVTSEVSPEKWQAVEAQMLL